jgi:hypothetical protein
MARKTTVKPRRAEAVFAPEGMYPITLCPTCWSRPSVVGRERKQVESRERIWNWNSDVRDGLSVSVLNYPCANPDCNTIIKVVLPSNKVDLNEVLWINRHRLKGKDAEKYRLGKHIKDIWFSPDAEPKEVLTTLNTPRKGEKPKNKHIEYSVRRDGGWLIIVCDELRDDYPKHWTLVEGAIKTRLVSEQCQKILAWFKKRGININPDAAWQHGKTDPPKSEVKEEARPVRTGRKKEPVQRHEETPAQQEPQKNAKAKPTTKAARGASKKPETVKKERGAPRTPTPKKSAIEAVISEQGPWLFIDCPTLNLAYPSGWVKDEQGRVKIRKGTQRHEQVKTFFKKKGVRVP